MIVQPLPRARNLEARRRLRTLQLGMSWFPEQAGNGLDRVYHALVGHLPQVGVDVRGLVAGSAGVSDSSGGHVHGFASDREALRGRLLAARHQIAAALRTEPLDLVAAHFALYAAPALDLIWRHPFVVHFHGPWAAESAVEGGSRAGVAVKRLVERSVYGRADRLIVLSEAFRDVLCDSYGVDPERVRIVAGGVDTERFDTGLGREEARRRLGWSPDRPTVLSVRRLARRMGLDRLLEAMQAVRTREPDSLLLIAGQGPLEAELRAQALAAGLGDHIEFLGFVPEADLPLAYRAADVTIVPTVALEGFGLTTVESLAAGTPVLVTPNGGLPEVVRGLSPDLVLASAEPEDLAAGLLGALQGAAWIPTAEECQAYARHHFGWNRVAEETRAVYEEVVA